MATSDLCVFPAQKTCCQVKRLELRLGHPRRSITELFLDPSPPPLPSLAAAYRASIDRVLKLLKNNAGVRDTQVLSFPMENLRSRAQVTAEGGRSG